MNVVSSAGCEGHDCEFKLQGRSVGWNEGRMEEQEASSSDASTANRLRGTDVAASSLHCSAKSRQ